MKIKIKLFALFRELAGRKEVELDFNDDSVTVRDVIKALGDRVNKELAELIMEKYQQLSSLLILVNGRNIRLLKGLETTLKDGDEVAIFPPGAGGSVAKNACLKSIG
ncbi:MAG: ubiquitin-like small modifier protein 1 [Candidatus Njordarchaeales archaeon]